MNKFLLYTYIYYLKYKIFYVYDIHIILINKFENCMVSMNTNYFRTNNIQK